MVFNSIPIRFREYKSFNFIGNIEGVFPFLGKRKELELFNEISGRTFKRLFEDIILRQSDRDIFFKKEFWKYKASDIDGEKVWCLNEGCSQKDKEQLKNIMFDYGNAKYQCLPFLSPDFDDSKQIARKYIYIFGDANSSKIVLQYEYFSENDRYYKVYDRGENQELNNSRDKSSNSTQAVMLPLDSHGNVPNYFFALSGIKLSVERIRQIETQLQRRRKSSRTISVPIMKTKRDYEKYEEDYLEACRNYEDYVLRDRELEKLIKERGAFSQKGFSGKEYHYITYISRRYKANNWNDYKYKDITWDPEQGKSRNIIFLTDYADHISGLNSDYTSYYNKFVTFNTYDKKNKKKVKRFKLKYLSDRIREVFYSEKHSDFIDYSVYARPHEFNSILEGTERLEIYEERERGFKEIERYLSKINKPKKKLEKGMENPDFWNACDEWTHNYLKEEYEHYEKFIKLAIIITAWMRSDSFHSVMFDYFFYIEENDRVNFNSLLSNIISSLGNCQPGLDFIRESVTDSDYQLNKLPELDKMLNDWAKYIKKGGASEEQQKKLLYSLYDQLEEKAWFSTLFFTVRKTYNDLLAEVLTTCIPATVDVKITKRILEKLVLKTVFIDGLSIPTYETYLKTAKGPMSRMKYENKVANFKSERVKAYSSANELMINGQPVEIGFVEENGHIVTKKVNAEIYVVKEKSKLGKYFIKENLDKVTRGIELCNVVISVKSLLVSENESEFIYNSIDTTGSILDFLLTIKDVKVIGLASGLIDSLLAYNDAQEALNRGNSISYISNSIASLAALAGGIGAAVGATALPFTIAVGILYAGGKIIGDIFYETELESWLSHCYFGKNYGGNVADKLIDAQPPWSPVKFEDWDDDDLDLQIDTLNHLLLGYDFELCLYTNNIERPEIGRVVYSSAAAIKVKLDTRKFYRKYSYFMISIWFEDDTGNRQDVVDSKIIKLDNKSSEDSYIDSHYSVNERKSACFEILLYDLIEGNKLPNYLGYGDMSSKIEYNGLNRILTGSSKYKYLFVATRFDLHGDERLFFPRDKFKIFKVELTEYKKRPVDYSSGETAYYKKEEVHGYQESREDYCHIIF